MALEIKKLKLRPAYQVVSEELQRRIVDGSLKPGKSLPSETELAEMFGVNRSTVREGIRQLQSEGLVRREARKRLVVSHPEHADLAPRTSRAMVMHGVTFRELWEIAMELEPLSAAMASDRADSELLARLEKNLEETRLTVKNGGSPVQLDTEFHTLVSLAAKNRVLVLAREPIGLLLYPAFEAIRPHLPQSGKRLIEAHQHILDAIRKRDRDEASTWMRKHITDFRRGWEMAKLKMDEQIAP